VGKPIEELLQRRYQKFRRMGVFLEAVQTDQPEPSAGPSEPTAEPQPAGSSLDPVSD
jgi:hypothetical protein